MKIGRSIKIILEATKFTRAQLAARLRISRVCLSYLENDKRNCSVKILKRISKVFHISAIYTITASDQNFQRQFPDTFNTIKSRMETLAAQSVLKLESKPAA